MWNMILSPTTPTVCLEQKSENFQSRNVTLSMPSQSKQDCFLKKEADGTLAALEFLIACGERLAFALVKFSDIIMKEIC